MTPLGSIFKSGATKPPKIDQHSLFTSIQVSVPILEGKLQVYEPWRRKRNRPKECHVTLYANETSPFVVWSKVDKVKPPGSGAASSSGSESPTSTFSKIRCVLSVSRAKMCKTTGGSFEVTDFASSLTFRFIADSVREANRWVEKLAEESLREANLDMRSICSSCSSFSSSTSSFSSHTSPDSVDGAARCFSVSSVDASERKIFHKKSASFSDTNGAMIHLLSTGGSLPPPPPSVGRINEDDDKGENLEQDVFTVKTTEDHLAACRLGHIRSNSKTFPRAVGSRQPHIRAQPHLGISLAIDKQRPELRNALKCESNYDRTLSIASRDRSGLPFSEFFVNVPNC